MAEYYAFYVGKGEGCDYTIGCNQKFVKLESSNVEDALTEVENDIDESYGPSEYQPDGLPFKSITVFEVSNYQIFDIKAHEESVRNMVLEATKEKEEEKERAEFERLSKKFSKDKK